MIENEFGESSVPSPFLPSLSVCLCLDVFNLNRKTVAPKLLISRGMGDSYMARKNYTVGCRKGSNRMFHVFSLLVYHTNFIVIFSRIDSPSERVDNDSALI